MKKITKRIPPHDHRLSLWIISNGDLLNGDLLWCYVCGAWRPNRAGRMPWYRPSGDKTINPACKG